MELSLQHLIRNQKSKIQNRIRKNARSGGLRSMQRCNDMAGENREYVFLECTESGVRHYRTQKRVKGQNIKKLELKKYNAKLKKHTVHKEKKK